MNPTVQQIGEALQALFAGTGDDAQKKAHEILEHFQKTPEAWQLAHDLLCVQHTNAPWQTYCQMFGIKSLE
jgi:hypothetical protein